MEGFWGPRARGTRRAMRRATVTAAVALAVGLLTFCTGAWAATGTELCMPKAEGAAVLTPHHGKCKKNYTLTKLGVEGKRRQARALPAPPAKPGRKARRAPKAKRAQKANTGPKEPEGKKGEAGSGLSAEQIEQLKALLPHITLIASGVGGKPTIRFSGVNVQIVNGSGKTSTVNGEGNLVIGYDENPKGRTPRPARTT